MFINGAILKRGKEEFAIIETKSCTVKSNFEAAHARKSLSSIFKGLPIILMSQDSKGKKAYNGRPELISFVKEISDKELPWKRYAFNK